LIGRAYRQTRLAEMRAAAEKQKFDHVREISKPDYASQVSDASHDHWVVVHMYHDSIEASRYLHQSMQKVALKHKDIQFLRIQADRCVENYPNRLVPTLLLYKDGAVRLQLTSMKTQQCSVNNLEAVLFSLDAIEKPDFEQDETER
jgi:hypothetical protein